MGMIYHCPYCNWQGTEPNRAEYPDTIEGWDAYEDDMREFEYEQRNHDCSKYGAATAA